MEARPLLPHRRGRERRRARRRRKRCPSTSSRRKDFYRDRELWSDARYFRCNSPQGLEAQWGALQFPTIGDDPPASAAWGYCDRDYPRAEIVSPYRFETAKAHYAALLEEAKTQGRTDALHASDAT